MFLIKLRQQSVFFQSYPVVCQPGECGQVTYTAQPQSAQTVVGMNGIVYTQQVQPTATTIQYQGIEIAR